MHTPPTRQSTDSPRHGVMAGSAANVADTTPPVLVAGPADGQDAAATLVFTFSEPVKLGNGTLVLQTGGNTVYAADVIGNPHITVSGNTVSFDPPADLDVKSDYLVQFTRGAILDLAGNPVAGTNGVLVSFETGISATPVDATGTSGSDTLHGSDFADTISGGDGADFLYGYGGDDILDGGNETTNVDFAGDYLWGGAGNDTLHGRDGADRLIGGDGNDALHGGAHRDVLRGGVGDDLLDGGSGDDELRDDAGQDVLLGGDGNDRLVAGSASTGRLDGGDGDDRLNGYGGADFSGGSGNDSLGIILAGGTSASNVDAGAGDDWIELVFNSPVDARLDIHGGDGADTYVLDVQGMAPGATTRVRVTDFSAGAHGDRINLFRLLGQDYDGNPFGKGLLRLVASGADTLLQLRSGTPGGGYHTLLELAGVAPGALTRANFVGDIDPGGSPVGLDLSGTDSYDSLAGTIMDDTIDGRGGNDHLYGNGGNDTVSGGDGDDHLVGGSGNDTLSGGAGSDTLDESADARGSNRLDGGAGDDTLSAGKGADTLLGGDGQDTLSAVDTGDGAERAISLSGGAGDDLLRLGIVSGTASIKAEGGLGADTFALMATGSKLDILDFSAAQGDQLDLRPLVPDELDDNPFGPLGYLKLEQAGSDVLLYLDRDGAAGTAHGFTLVATLAGVPLASLTRERFSGGYDRLGSDTGFTIAGTAESDTLEGADLDDLIRGNGGHDTIRGGKGDDQIDGGDEPGYGDRLYGESGKDLLRGGAGDDELDGGTGNDQLFGGDGGDTLDGGAGDDRLLGGAGDDTLVDASGNNVLEGGDGNDKLQGATYWETGGTTPFSISMDGGAGDDVFEASLDVDTVLGGTGNDYIRILTSNKDLSTQAPMRIDGGAGEDTIALSAYGHAALTVVATGGEGRDRYTFTSSDTMPVLAITDFTAGANGDLVDVFSLLDYADGSGNPFGTLNKLRLEQRGSDTVLQRESAGAAVEWRDVVVFRDTPLASLTADNFSDGARPDGSPVGYVRSGTDGRDRIEGGRLDDTLRGGDGDDTLSGGAGNDSLHGDAGDDHLDGGAGDDHLAGGAGNDSLYDSAGTNRLEGGDGDDRLHTNSRGGSELVGGLGNDIFSAHGVNALLDGGAGDDRFDVGQFSFTAAATEVLIRIHGGDGNDAITTTFGSNGLSRQVDIVADGGAGQDTYHANQVPRNGLLTILDFQTGEGGDLIDLGRLISWEHGPNPFSAGNGMRIVQRGADAVLQARGLEDGNPVYRDVIVFAGIDKAAIGAANVAWGFNPDGSSLGRSMSGTGAADLLSGGWLDDRIAGGAGDDRLEGLAGSDHLLGGDGNDVLLGDAYGFTPLGQGTPVYAGDDVLEGGAGDDELTSQGGNDVLRGGDGNDSLLLDTGWSATVPPQHRVAMHGDAGDDLLRVQPFRDTPYDIVLEGGTGRDTFSIGWLPSQGSLLITDFQAGAGGDVLDVFDITEVRLGDISPFATGQYRFVQRGTDAVLQIDADGKGEHKDFLTLKNVDKDQLVAANMTHGLHPAGATAGFSWTGTDAGEYLTGEWLDDELRGGGGDDILDGSRGNDLLDGGDGDDRLSDRHGRDTLLGGAGNDSLDGYGDDILRGGDGDDILVNMSRGGTLDGGNGADRLWVRGDNEAAMVAGLQSTMLGGDGKDVFMVQSWVDESIAHATGGAGRDVFEAGGHYTVTDFQAGAGGDQISVSFLLGWVRDHNPFTLGVMRLVQDGADTLLQFDRFLDDAGPGFKTIMTLTGVNAASVTAANILEGHSPWPTPPVVTPPPPPPPPPQPPPPPPPSPPPVAADPPITSVGGGGDEVLSGGSGNDRLDGGAGNDVLAGGAGNDTLTGGEGLDSARYAGTRADYTVTRTAGGFQVVDKRGTGDGSDTLNGVERIAFADGALALDVDGVAGQAFRIYRAAFDRAPDLKGMGFWLQTMDQGISLVEIAAGFAASQEFADVYGSAPTNAEIITRFYTNILHREPEAAGFAYWLDVLDSKKASLPQVLASISESAENQVAVAELIATGIPFTPWA